jgi:hypothetical protein
MRERGSRLEAEDLRSLGIVAVYGRTNRRNKDSREELTKKN